MRRRVGERREPLADERRRRRSPRGVTSAPRRSPPPPTSIPRSSSRRWIATMLSGSGALPWRAPTTRSVPPATGAGRRRRARRAPRRHVRCGDEALDAHALLPWIAAHTRSGVIGSCRTGADRPARSRSRSRPAVGTHGGSPTPFEPFGPGVRRVRLDPGDVDLRRVGGGHELVVEQVRVALAAVLVELRALGERLADAHHDAAVDLPVGADRG